jgi:hypothetical protein
MSKLSNDCIIKKYGATMSTKIDNFNPTHIGTVSGIRFFEHPMYGDDSQMIVKQDGNWNLTVFWEPPDFDELS